MRQDPFITDLHSYPVLMHFGLQDLTFITASRHLLMLQPSKHVKRAMSERVLTSAQKAAWKTQWCHLFCCHTTSY